jgi:hypothetical protein
MPRSWGMMVVALAMVSCDGAPAAGQEGAAKGRWVRALYSGRNQSVQDLKGFLEDNYGDDGSVRVSAGPTANVLGIRATSQSALDEVLKTLEVMDRPARMIAFQAVVIDLAAPAEGRESAAVDAGLLTGSAEDVLKTAQAWVREGKAARVRSYTLSALDNQIAESSTSELAPRVVGATFGARPFDPQRGEGPRGSMPQYKDEKLGVTLSVIPRITDTKDILCEMIFNCSELREAAGAEPAGGDKLGLSRVVQAKTATTVSIPNGRSVVVSGGNGTGTSPQGTGLLVVSARVVEGAGEKTR